MREIVFRAKTTSKHRSDFDNIWVEGNLIRSGEKYYIHPDGNRVSVKGELGKLIIMHEVLPETICQKTGMHDATRWEQLSKAEQRQFLLQWNYEESRMNQLEDWKGRGIWENDILVAHLDESYPEDETYSQAIWHKNGWYTKEKNSSDYSPLEKFDEENFVIAGNIFDNPELMR